MAKGISPHQLEARMNGIPTLGSGAIYPVPEEDIVCDPFQIPSWWPRLYGLDVGWNKTAAIWLAYDRDTDTVYCNSEHYRGHAEAAVHAKAIRMRGSWIPGVIDTAAKGRSQVDGRSLWEMYSDEGLILHKANKAVEAGIMQVFERLSTGRLKIFSTLQHTLSEYRLYRRDEKGRIVKSNDHCLHPDTQVITPNGNRKIKDMVGTTGKVLTIGGIWTNYYNCRKTADNQKTITVHFDDGAKVTCTPDHRFLTPKGWIEAQDLQGEYCYNAVSQSIQGKSLCKSMLYPTLSKSLMGFVTTFAGYISSAMACVCTELFGNRSMAERYQTAGMFITPTMTAAIISPTTYALSLLQSICGITTKVSAPRCHQKPVKRLEHGMVAKKAATGTKSITRSTNTNCTQKPHSPASSAEASLMPKKQDRTAFALTNANQPGVERKGLMTLLGRALTAAKNSLSTNTAPQKHVHENALVRCSRVQRSSETDVYCLTVPETEAFAVENGVIVHNCMDSLRYAIMGLHHATTRPVQNTGAGSAPGDYTTGY